ncbi:MAG: DUF503 domain-containing protein [Ktedonobacterales bacterium]|nr:DUF503 domain-containing protein [Ktedonobacterales bacterium]
MFVGVCRLTLHVPASASLKDKRQVIRSVLARARQRFEIAAAEVAHQDTWQLATLGLACVSNDAHHAEEVLEAACRYVEESRPDVMVTEAHIEVLPFDA